VASGEALLANGAATNGDAIINKIDLQLDDPAVQNPVVYEAEQAPNIDQITLAPVQLRSG
jgi:hypothetical protein